MNESMVEEKLSRIIGLTEGDTSGPTIIAIGGLHGNETSGVEALEQIIDILPESHQFKGRFLAVRGNLKALEEGVRYIDEDLNRIWFPSIIDKIRRTPKAKLESSERQEIKDLLHILDDFLIDDSTEPTIFADLHSFSAGGNMFAITAPKQEHINLFARMHVPLVFGIEKTLRGAALSYFQDQGYVTFAFEGGQHQDSMTVHNNTAAMLTLLDELGCIDASALPAFRDPETFLAEQNKQIPKQVELVYQHMIEPGDNFEMQPGFKNFQVVTEGEWLATDKNGKIMAQCGGYLIMPLYQQQGNDGFFIAQDHKNV